MRKQQNFRESSIMRHTGGILAQIIVALAAAASCTTVHAGSVHSESHVWKNVTVGGGGFVPGIVFSRAEKGLAYIRTDIGGAYRWDANLMSWIPLEDGVAEGNYLGSAAHMSAPTAGASSMETRKGIERNRAMRENGNGGAQQPQMRPSGG
jgi:hypothetical protein